MATKQLTTTAPTVPTFHERLAAMRAATAQPHVEALEIARANFDAKIVAAVSNRVDAVLDAILAF